MTAAKAAVKLRPTKITLTNDDNRYNVVARTVRLDPRDNSVLETLAEQEVLPNQYRAIEFNGVNEAVVIIPTLVQA